MAAVLCCLSVAVNAQDEAGQTVSSSVAVVPPRPVEKKSSRRDKNQQGDAWQGSFPLRDSKTRMKIGGAVELDMIHDTDDIACKGQFIASTIATGNDINNQNADDQNHVSINPSALYVETRTPLDQRRLTAYLSVDLFGGELTDTPDLRLRQAYLELSDKEQGSENYLF